MNGWSYLLLLLLTSQKKGSKETTKFDSLSCWVRCIILYYDVLNTPFPPVFGNDACIEHCIVKMVKVCSTSLTSQHACTKKKTLGLATESPINVAWPLQVADLIKFEKMKNTAAMNEEVPGSRLIVKRSGVRISLPSQSINLYFKCDFRCHCWSEI